jgi:hypothetical protein
MIQWIIASEERRELERAAGGSPAQQIQGHCAHKAGAALWYDSLTSLMRKFHWNKRICNKCLLCLFFLT